MRTRFRYRYAANDKRVSLTLFSICMYEVIFLCDCCEGRSKTQPTLHIVCATLPPQQTVLSCTVWLACASPLYFCCCSPSDFRACAQLFCQLTQIASRVKSNIIDSCPHTNTLPWGIISNRVATKWWLTYDDWKDKADILGRHRVKTVVEPNK